MYTISAFYFDIITISLQLWHDSVHSFRVNDPTNKDCLSVRGKIFSANLLKKIYEELYSKISDTCWGKNQFYCNVCSWENLNYWSQSVKLWNNILFPVSHPFLVERDTFSQTGYLILELNFSSKVENTAFTVLKSLNHLSIRQNVSQLLIASCIVCFQIYYVICPLLTVL